MRSLVVFGVLLALFSPPARTNQPQAQIPETGSLVIDAELPVGSVRGDYFEAGWLFVDGRLIGRLPVKRTITLRWGSHDVKVVVGAYTKEQPRYFTVRWPRYFMNRGATQTLVMAPIIESTINGERPPAGVEYVPSPDPPEPRRLSITPENASSFAAAEQQAILAATQLLITGEGTDYRKLIEAKVRLENTPPERPLVYIAVSDARGGPRDFDSYQLRFLGRTLRPNAGGWGQNVVEYSPRLSASDRQNAEAYIESLKLASARLDAIVDEAIRDLIAILEKRR